VYAHPLQVFRRHGENAYNAIESSLGGQYLSAPHVGRALWTIDVNRDHRTDLAVTHQTEPVALLVNRTRDSGAWVELELRGRRCARDAIGTRIHVHSGQQHRIAAVTAGDGYLCSNERVIRIGIGQAAKTADFTVIWPDGTEQRLKHLPANTGWMIVQGDEAPFQTTP
jgi:hypothetical protein